MRLRIDHQGDSVTDLTCDACGGTVSDARLCNTDTNKLRYHLGDMTGHHDELTTAMTRQVRMVAMSDGGRAAAANLDWSVMGDRWLDTLSPADLRKINVPFQRSAAETLRSMRSTLVSWVRLLHEEHQVAYPQDTITAMSLLLEANLPILRQHPAAGDFHLEITGLVGDIMRIIDTPAPHAPVVGQCFELLEDKTPCPGEVKAFRPPDVRPFLRCGYCRVEYLPEQWSTVGDRILRRKRTIDVNGAAALVQRLAG